MFVRRGLALMIHFQQLLHLVLCENGAPVNVRIIIPEGETEASIYQCVADANPAPTSFVWRREGQRLPDSVRPEGDRLHFLELTSDLNGQYSCEVTNQYGTATGFIYRFIEETAVNTNDRKTYEEL